MPPFDRMFPPLQVLAFVSQVHNVDLPEDAVDLDSVQLGQVGTCYMM